MNRTKRLNGACAECGGPLEFAAENIGLTMQCPHCGQPTELLLAPPPHEPAVPRRLVAWLIVAVIVLALGLAGALIALNRAERWAVEHKAGAGQPVKP